MEVDYKRLGQELLWNRKGKGLKQTDIEKRTDYRLRQPAISAMEHGDLRMSVDTLVDYCNAIGIRTDIVLDPYLTTSVEDEMSDAIVDPYVVQLARILKCCTSTEKTSILKVVQTIIEMNHPDAGSS